MTNIEKVLKEDDKLADPNTAEKEKLNIIDKKLKRESKGDFLWYILIGFVIYLTFF